MWSLGSGQLNKNLDDTSGSFATLSNRKHSIGRYHAWFRVINSYIIFWFSIANIIIFITDLSGKYFLEWLFSQWNVKKYQMACSSSSQKSKDVQMFSLYRTEKILTFDTKAGTIGFLLAFLLERWLEQIIHYLNSLWFITTIILVPKCCILPFSCVNKPLFYIICF